MPKIIRFHETGGADVLQIEDLPLEEPSEGEVRLKVEDVRLAARSLGRITGRVDVEDVLDVIFRDFCIGK